MITLLNEVSKISPLANKYNAQLERLSISTVRDLLWHLPLRYEDYSNVSLIDNLRKGDDVVVVVKIVSIVARRGWRSKKNITEAIIEDDSGQMKAVWFNQPYLTKVLTQGSTFYLSGKVIDFYGLTLSNPTHERFDKEIQALHFGNLTPIYPSTQRLTQKLLRFFISSALKKNPNIVEHIDEEFLKKEHMLTLPEAVKNIHFPKSHEVQQQAVYRLKFEELWQVQEKSRELRKRLEKLKGHPLASNESSLTSWLDSLSFELTPGQKEAWKEISRDIEKPYPMIRLLQGEVGSGKTIVAASALYKATLSGSQGAIMTPTEVLSNQHFETFASLFKNFDVTIALLTRTSKLVSRHGNVATSTRDSIKKGIRAGTLDIVIGTHALIQTEVAFKRLALIVVDEQQRFGVKQRLEIVKKNKDATIPHMLALTATPIPRTYTHFLYGAIDVSVLSDMPKGRKKIITKLVNRSDEKTVYVAIKKELDAGRQAFVICPVIMESDSLGVEAVTSEEEKLKVAFPRYSIGLLHGRMSGPLKEKAMRAFVKGEIDILISTAVVEVGIDVSNATVMMIESPERFGLAQLHQFRGRVGRGEYQSYCYIIAEDTIAQTNERLKFFTKIDNGFDLSEKDLSVRGPGELYGFAQSGLSQFKIATLKDVEIMKKVKKLVGD